MPAELLEDLRLAALERSGVLDTPPDPQFDRITRLAAQFFGAPMAAVAFVTRDRTWFKSTYGFRSSQLARSASFCSRIVACRDAVVIPDAAVDERFTGLALVAGDPRVRFYAGVPVSSPDGFAIGALSIMDKRPRGPLSESENRTLHDFGALVGKELNRSSSADSASHDASAPTPGDGGQASSLLSALVQGAEDAIVSTDLNGVILTWNPGAERLCGYSAEEAVGRPILMTVPPDRREEAREMIGKALQGQPTLRRETVRIRKDGASRYVSLSVSAIIAADGKPVGISGIAHDITPRVEALARLRASEERHQLLIEHGMEVIAVISDTAAFMYLSPSSERVFGYPPESVIGSNGMDYVHPDDKPAIQTALENLHSLPGATATLRLRLKHRHGGWRAVECAATNCLHVSGLSGIVVNVRDISERVRYEEELRTSQDQLRRLATRVESAREEERARISREVHDEFGQMLAVLKLDLQTLESRHRPRSAAARSEFDKRVAAMVRDIDLSMNTARRIAAELRPAVFEDLGLAAALDWQLQDFESRTGIRCRRLDLHQDAGLAAGPSLAAFRIFQEILTNVIRHANATTLEVQVETDRELFTLRVSDNGKGFDASLLSPSRSLGLLGMRERAGLHGGAIEWSSGRRGGTTVTVRFPRVVGDTPVDGAAAPPLDR